MSQHMLTIKTKKASTQVILGYDRPLKDTFWTCYFQDGDIRAHTEDETKSLLDVLQEQMSLSERQLDPLATALTAIGKAVYTEVLADDPSMQAVHLSELLSTATPRAQVLAELNKIQEFKDFNRVVEYPEVDLAAA